MAPIVYSVEIARPPDEVFAYMSDLSRFPEWQQEVVNAGIEGDGVMRQGARMTMTRRMGKSQRTFITEITDYDPPRSQGFRGISGPVRPVGHSRVDPLDNGERSRVSFQLDFDGAGFGKLLVPVARRHAAREVPVAHEKLKELLESGAA